MPPQTAIDVRSVTREDHDLIWKVLARSRWKHQHLDWLDPLDLIGRPPFLLATQRSQPVGLLACPPDPPEVAWLRVFAVSSDHRPDSIWERLWPLAANQAKELGVRQVFALLLGQWLAPLLQASNFRENNAVIFYEWAGRPPPSIPTTAGVLRRMRAVDTPGVVEVDHRAFNPAWQNSPAELAAALGAAARASVIEIEGHIVAYQIATESVFGIHLARIAVDPDWQHRGLGTALVTDLLHQALQRGFNRVSVNTQRDNVRSRRLYQRLGFCETGQRFPVFQFDSGEL